MTVPTPVFLRPNQPADRFYRGGAGIAAFRGAGAAGDRVPEDWLASTTALFGEPLVGQTRLDDGRLLREHIDEDPVAWLGPDHVARFGTDPALLTKLLDAGERLPVHVHPDGGFSRERLGLAHGKTEAWIALTGGEVRLGFAREVSRDELAGWVAAQDADALLAATNLLSVEPGEVILVPAGLPHAIGSGLMVIELQEPSDLSILLEWRDFAVDGAADGHLGLGFDVALDAVDRSAWTPDRLAALRGAAPDATGELLPPAAAPFFRVERHRVRGTGRLDAGFGVLVVTSGSGHVTAEADDGRRPVRRGDTLLVPAAAGGLRLDGDLELLRARPPAVATASVAVPAGASAAGGAPTAGASAADGEALR